MKQVKTKFCIVLAAFFMVALLAVGMISPASTFTASAATYSNVLDDLTKDNSFNIGDYPDNANDYSVKVIQIAESTRGELFIYTYQPCRLKRALRVTSVNMALSKEFEDIADSLDIIDTDDGYYQGYAGGGAGGGGGSGCSLLSANTIAASEEITQAKLYALTLLSSWGTLCKYKVNDFTVSADKVRYYNITSIYREWDVKIDGVQTGDQTVTEKAYAVGQLWTVGTFGNNVVYDAAEIEVIQVTAEHVGMRRYSEGFKFDGTYTCDSHYLAFSCDHAIDRLISADISFYTRDYTARAGSRTKYEGKVEHSRTLYDYEKVETDSDGWFNGGDYVFDRMTSTAEFVTSLREQGSSITDEEVQLLTSYDWILNFWETEYKCEAGGKDVLISCLIPFGFVWTIVNACTTTGTIVTDVTLMRLEFEYEGTIYNLGVVSDKQTGPETPSGSEINSVIKFFNDFWEKIKNFFTGHSDWWVYLIVVLAAIILLPLVLSIFIPALRSVLASIFNAIGKALLWLFKGLWWLVCLPFRGIAALIRKHRERKDE